MPRMHKPALEATSHATSGAAVWLAALLAAAVMPGCAAKSRLEPPPRLSAMADFPPTTLYVARRRWHVDVGLNAGAVREPLAGVLRALPGARFAFFGFGDRRYLLSKNRDAPVLLAALWPGPALLLVTGLSEPPDQAFGRDQVIELPMTSEQSRELQAFLWRSIDTGPATHATDGTTREGEGTTRDGTAVPYADGPYPGSVYFAAGARYSALHTCITWAAEALRAAGFPVRSRLTVLAGQLWRQVLALRASIAGGRISVLADHRGAAALWDDHGRLRGRGRTAAADTTG
jgi:hypothetical protein